MFNVMTGVLYVHQIHEHFFVTFDFLTGISNSYNHGPSLKY